MFSAHKFTLLLTTTIHGYSQLSLLSIPSPSHTVSSSLVYPTDTTSSISKSTPYHPKFHLCLPDYQLPPNVFSHQRLIRGLGISISQCLPLHTWDNNNLFPFREKGKETKKHYCKVILPFWLFCSKCSFHLQLSKKWTAAPHHHQGPLLALAQSYPSPPGSHS